MSNTKSRIPGICKGEVEMSEDFDELPPELLSKFYNKVSFIELMRNSPLVGIELDI